MDSQLSILIVNAIATPLLVILTMWVKSLIYTGDRRQRREDEYILTLGKRIENLEREIKEVRVELKNRDSEYIELYKQHTTLKAKYEVLQTDYNQTRKELHDTQVELTALKEDIRIKAAAVVAQMQKI